MATKPTGHPCLVNAHCLSGWCNEGKCTLGILDSPCNPASDPVPACVSYAYCNAAIAKCVQNTIVSPKVGLFDDPCHLSNVCDYRLTCIDGLCNKPLGLGEACISSHQCDDGSDCIRHQCKRRCVRIGVDCVTDWHTKLTPESLIKYHVAEDEHDYKRFRRAMHHEPEEFLLDNYVSLESTSLHIETMGAIQSQVNEPPRIFDCAPDDRLEYTPPAVPFVFIAAWATVVCTIAVLSIAYCIYRMRAWSKNRTMKQRFRTRACSHFRLPQTRSV